MYAVLAEESLTRLFSNTKCKMLPFCAKAVVKESCNFELEEEKEDNFGCLVTFGFSTFMMLFVPLGVLYFMKTLENEW